MAPIHQVFGTAELLEAILLHLPIRDALLLQQLRIAWHDTITSSAELQRALFLRPVLQRSVVNTKNPRSADKRIHNMTLSTTCNQVPNKPGSKALFTSFLPIEKCGANFSYLLTARCLPKYYSDYRTANWQNMLICQPPRETEHFFFNSTSDSASYDTFMGFITTGSSEKSKLLLLLSGATIHHGKQFGLDAMRLEQAGGVTLGTFVEALENAKERFEGATKKKMKGREFRFGWVRGGGCMEAVVEFWMDIKTVQAEKLVALQRMVVEDDDEDDEEYEGGDEDEDEQMLDVGLL